MPTQKRAKPTSSPKTSPYSAKKSTPVAKTFSSERQTRPSFSKPGKSPSSPTRQDSKQGSRPNPGQESRPKPSRQPSFDSTARPSRPNPATAAKPAPRATLPIPSVMVTRRASESLRNGHLWVYASDIEQIELGPTKTPVKTDDPPSLIPVVDNRGIPLGTALYSPISQITLRLVSRELITQPQWLTQLAARLRTAIQRRKSLLNEETNACRLVFSEADDLPGLIVDKYAHIVIVQLLAKGLDNQETRTTCIKVLAEEFGDAPLTISERPDPRIRELEGLSAPATTPLYTSNLKAPITSTVFRLNGLSFHFDVNSGQKTGAFLDQRQNYLAAATWAKALGAKKALDVCTYQGGFALHLAQVCDSVTGIDASRASLEVAETNLETNRGQITAAVDWVEADAFEILRAWSDAPATESSQWDLIVLDPPAFAKSKRAVEGALRGYKELNLRALRMIRPGGLLITCSCSHHVTWTDLESAVASAAVDAHRRVTLLERKGAAQDHPVLLNLPETEYLKCLVCRVD
jgi:23S rRNA (cytosine1962-C5)-methyltransferase